MSNKKEQYKNKQLALWEDSSSDSEEDSSSIDDVVVARSAPDRSADKVSPGIYIVIAWLNDRRCDVTKEYLGRVVKFGMSSEKVRVGCFLGRYVRKCHDVTKNIIGKSPIPMKGALGGNFVRYGPMELPDYEAVKNHPEFITLYSQFTSIVGKEGSYLFMQAIVDYDNTRHVGEYSEKMDHDEKERRELDPSRHPYLQKKLTDFFGAKNKKYGKKKVCFGRFKEG